MIRLSVRFRHRCTFNRISSRYPHLRLSHWFNVNTEYLEVTGASPEELADIRRRLSRIRRRGTRVRTFATEEAGTVGFVVRSGARDSPIVDKILDRHSALLLPPIHYREGWEEYRILLLEERVRASLVRDLATHGEVQLTRIAVDRPAPRLESADLSLRDLFGELSPRQSTALRLAYAHGYFEMPRRVDLRTLARRDGVGRSTFEELVRKAERKVMRSALRLLDPPRPPVRSSGRGRRR